MKCKKGKFVLEVNEPEFSFKYSLPRPFRLAERFILIMFAIINRNFVMYSHASDRMLTRHNDEFMNDKRNIQTSLVSDSSMKMSESTNSPDRFFNEVKVGANFMSWQGSQVSLSYARLFNHKFLKRWQITGGLRIPF